MKTLLCVSFRGYLFWVLFVIVWQPSLGYALTQDEARHFLSRTGFAPSPAELEPYLPLSRLQAIQLRLQSLTQHPYQTLPDELAPPIHETFVKKTATRKQRLAHRKALRQKMSRLQEWWFHEMLTTQSPFTENLTLFWHNHFVSSAQKVRRPEMMAQQNITLRRHSHGNFKDLLKAMLHDPALLQYLDNHRNRKGKINENLGRELLELFTLGEGNYTENDIKNTARILTGLRFKAKTGESHFVQKHYDSGQKTLFNQSGKFTVNDLVEILLKHPDTALFITNKLWSHFITTPIPAKTHQQFAKNFRKHYELTLLISAILQHDDFWSSSNRGTQIKSPVNLTVGFYRQLEWYPKKIRPILHHTKRMGQNILYPPNVKGWKIDLGWINTTSLLARQNFIRGVSRGMAINRHSKKWRLNITQWKNILIAQPLQRHSLEIKNAMTVKQIIATPYYHLQ